MHGPQKTQTAPSYEGKGKGRALPPINWLADNGASTITDDVESAFAADIQRAIDRSRRESLTHATRLSSGGGGDPGPSSSSSRSSSVSSVFSSPGASYSPMSPSTPASSPRSTPNSPSTRASSPNPTLASYYALSGTPSPTPSLPGGSSTLSALSAQTHSMTNPVAAAYRFVQPASAFARAPQAESQPQATRPAPPTPTPQRTPQSQGSWPRMTNAQRAAAGITRTYHKLGSRSPASRWRSSSESDADEDENTLPTTQAPMNTDTSTPSNENRANLAIEDDEDEDAELEEVHIDVRPPSARADDVKMGDFEPFVISVASTTTAPGTRFTYTHPPPANMNIRNPNTKSTSTSTSNHNKPPPARAPALGKPPAPRAMPAPLSGREAREAMLRRLEEEEERVEAEREARLAAQRRAKLAGHPRWGTAPAPAPSTPTPRLAAETPVAPAKPVRRLPTAPVPAPPTVRVAAGTPAALAQPVRVVPPARAVVARRPSGQQVGTRAETAPVDDTVSRTSSTPAQRMPAVRPVAARAPTPAQNVTSPRRSSKQTTTVPERVIAPTPLPALVQAARVDEKSKRDALLAQRAALDAVLDARLLPPPRGEPELARKHAELQEEIDTGRLPPLPMDDDEEEMYAEANEGNDVKEKEERKEQKETETEKETRKISGFPSRTAISLPELLNMRDAAPSPQVEEMSNVQTGMEVEAPGIQVANVASRHVLAAAPVKDVDVEMENEEEVQVKKPHNGTPPNASGDLGIMEQDDGAWPAPAYATYQHAAYQPALPAYMKRHIANAAPSTFDGAHLTVPPIDKDLGGDSMDTREHAGYLYDAQLPSCAPEYATYPSAPVALDTGDVEMGEMPLDAVAFHYSVQGTSAGTAIAPLGDGDDREFVQVREPDVSVNVVGMEADGVAGEDGNMEEGERERGERAGEGRGVAPSDSQHHAAVEVPTSTPVVALAATLRVDDDEEELPVRPRKAEKGRASYRVHPKHARASVPASSASRRGTTTRVRAPPTSVRTLASARAPRPTRAPTSVRPAPPTPAPVGVNSQAERSTVEPRVGAVATAAETPQSRAEETVRIDESETVAVRAGTNSLAVDVYAPIDVAVVRRQLTQARPTLPLLRRVLSRKIEELKKKENSMTVKGLAAKFPGMFMPFDVPRASASREGMMATPSPAPHVFDQARPAAAFATTPANKAFAFNFPVGAAKAADATPQPSVGAMPPPAPTPSRADIARTPLETPAPKTETGAAPASAAQEAQVAYKAPSAETAQEASDATETSFTDVLADFEAEIAALMLADLPDFLPTLAFTHESGAENNNASAVPSPTAHAQAEASQPDLAPTRNEGVRKTREARRRARASVREQERKQAATAAAAAAIQDESYDAPRVRGAHGTRVYGRRYRPYPNALAGIPSAREAQGSQAHAAPSQTCPAAPVVVEEGHVKVAPVEEVNEPKELKVEAPTVDDVGVKGAPQAASTPAPVVEAEVEVEESKATPANKTTDATVEPASQDQPSDATDSEDDTSAEDDASEGASDSEEEDEEEVLGEEDHNGDDARHVMPGDFFLSNPPPQNPPGLWPLGATIGVVSAVAFVRYRYA